ncbi:MAG: hypothetical protein FJ253_07960, partial [Phycisphaerae bacterium]|nr:hypothetical protein [Phycisphaerae bacterium]
MSVRAFALPALPLLALAGCRSYEPMPLDPLAASAAWSARSPDDERVRDFAARIDASESRSVGGFDPRDGLTMEEGEPVAVVFNRRLRVLREQAKVPLATAEFIGLWEDPVLGIELERILESVSNPWIVAASVGITIPISGRLDAAQALAGAEYAAMLQEIAAQEWRTRIELRERWVEWSAQRLRAELTNGLSSRLQRVDEIARRQQEAGVLSRIDARVF